MKSRDNPTIINADETLKEEVTKIVTTSFTSEAITSFLFNLNKHHALETLYRFNLLKIKEFYKKDYLLFGASKDQQIVGAVVIKKGGGITFLDKLKIYFPDILTLIIPMISIINLKRVIRISKYIKPPSSIKKPYYTVEAIGVSPEHQGQGIGTMLLNKVNEVAENNSKITGIYLFTGDKKNQILYEKFGYETLEEFQAEGITIYHMFRKNKFNQ